MPTPTLNMPAPLAEPAPARPVHALPPSIRLGHALREGDDALLPSVIAECRDVVEAARASLLPKEPRDANARIYLITNDLFLTWEKQQAGRELYEGEALEARVKIRELKMWAALLRPVLAAQAALDEAMAIYRAAAPKRETR